MLFQEEPKLIGSVAKESGVPIKTIRYYEELGLLKALGRTEGGFRLFNSKVLARLTFIKRAQSLGFTLSEIKDFLDVHDGGNLPCKYMKAKLQDKVAAINKQIQQLLILRRELEELLLGWETLPENSEKTICPLREKTKSRI